MTVKQLERAAVRAHRRGETFAQFWEANAAAIRAIEPHNQRKFGQFYRRLMQLVICGDEDGQEPIDADFAPRYADDETCKFDNTEIIT